MSIRPVDMQLVVQKNQDIHPAKQTVVSKLDNELVQAQKENKDISLKKQQTVNQTERSELKRVKNDDEDERQRNKKRQKKQENDDSTKKEASSGKSIKGKQSDAKASRRNVSSIGSRFDMKV